MEYPSDLTDKEGALSYGRRLAKDFEISISSAENYAMIGHSMLLIKRLGKT